MTIVELSDLVGAMLIGRTGGPLTLRLFLQPTMAVMLAIRAGVKDAHERRPAYFFWAVFASAARRKELLRQLWGDIRTPFIVAVVVDVIYELIVYRMVYPVQALIVATVLCVVPYLLFRGTVTRIIKLFSRP